MKRSDPSWYFEGYRAQTRIGPGGRSKTEYCYEGPRWAPELAPEALAGRKLFYGIGLLLFTALWLLLNLRPGSGGMAPWVGGFSFCTIAPLMFWWLGALHFLFGQAPWTKREYWVGWRRMSRAAAPAAALSDAAVIGELVYLCLWPERGRGDLLYLAGLVLCGLLGTAMAVDLLRHKARAMGDEQEKIVDLSQRNCEFE